MPQYLRDLVATCERTPCKPDPIALSMTIPEQVVSDPAAMTAEAVISTDIVDYTRQVVIASGMNLENYARNPVVLYEHGQSGWPFPIAQSIDENGILTIKKDDLVTEAKSFHGPTIAAAPGAYQFFALIDVGVVRATSVQVIPVTKSVYADRNGSKFDVIEESFFSEWSWCTLGVNPQALAKSMRLIVNDHVRQVHQLQTDCALSVLRKGSLGNERIGSAVRKSLMSMIPQAGASSPGYHFLEGAMNEDTNEPVVVSNAGDHEGVGETRSLETVTKAVGDEGAEGGPEIDASEATDDTAAEPEPVVEKPKPLGMQRMTEMHMAIQQVADHFEEVFTEVENETVLTGVEDVLAQMRALQSQIEGVFSEAYPDRRSLVEAPAEGGDEAGDGEFETEMKSLLAGDQRAFFQAKGMTGQLRRMSELDSTPAPLRKQLSAVCKSMSVLQDKAKKYEPPAPKGYVKKADFDAEVNKNRGLTERAEKLLATVKRMSQPAS